MKPSTRHHDSAVFVVAVAIAIAATRLAAPRDAHAFRAPSWEPAAHGAGEGLGDNFGAAVSSAGDVNGDGFSDWLVGDDGYNSHQGRAYLYLGGKNLSPNGTTAPYLTFTGQNPNDHFGYSVASAGDVNGDGYSDVLVGALNYSASGVNAGRVYLYLGGPSMDNVPDLVLTGETTFSYFSTSMAAVGDLNGDGFGDFMVGAPGFASDRGRIYVYYGSAAPDGT